MKHPICDRRNSRLSLGPRRRFSNCSSVNSSPSSSFSPSRFPVFFFPPPDVASLSSSTLPTSTKSTPALNSLSVSQTLLLPASGWMRRSRIVPSGLIGSELKNGDDGLLGYVLVMRCIFCCGSLFLLRDCNFKSPQSVLSSSYTAAILHFLSWCYDRKISSSWMYFRH